jgi:anti-anti-sigma factor
MLREHTTVAEGRPAACTTGQGVLHRGPHLLITRDDNDDGCHILTVSGELDLATAGPLTHALSTTIEQCAPGPVVVDLTPVAFLSAAGLSALFCAVGNAEQRGGRIGFVVDDRHALIRSLQLSGLEPNLPLFSTVEDARHTS